MNLFDKMTAEATKQLVRALIVIPVIFVVLGCVAVLLLFNV